MDNKTMPTVSVVIPTYNHASFLPRALRSVLDQVFTDWEAIVINNFSTDNTEEIVASFNDPRIKIYNFANNGLIAAARNEGIRRATGEYVAFLDSDDFWFPLKLKQCVELLKSSGADLACHAEVQMRNGLKERSLTYGPEEKSDYDTMVFGGNCASTSAVVVKRSYLSNVNGFVEDRTFNTSEDYDLWLRLSQAGCKFKFLEEELGEYLVHDANNSGAIDKHFNAILNVTESHFKNFEDTFINKLRKRLRRGVLCYGAARQAQSQMQYKMAIPYFTKALKLNPFHVKTYVAFFKSLIFATWLKNA